MPLHFGSQIEEHHAVRRDAGAFDVSHMRPVDLSGPDAKAFLQHLLANDVAKLRTPGKALYSCILNPEGGVVDDLICYWRGGDRYRLVVNAATADKDVDWMQAQLGDYSVALQRRDDLAMIAVQGPQARDKALPLLPEALREPVAALAPFVAAETTAQSGSNPKTATNTWFVARTGYTGEDGIEIMLPGDQAEAFWQVLMDAGIAPCGLGARDTLRLEAGMNLYGQDMDDTKGPLVSGLGWTIAWEPDTRDFIGRAALEQQRAAGTQPRLVGLLLEGRGVLRSHQPVLDGDGQPIGEVTSGGFSPTLERSIALARIKPHQGQSLKPGDQCAVDIRGKAVPARIVKPPFVRHGEAQIQL